MIEKLTRKFQAWVIPWFASGIGMVYSTDLVPLWIAFVGAHTMCFAFVIFYAVKLNIEIWKKDKENKK